MLAISENASLPELKSIIKQKDIVSRVEQMVSQGIAFNVEQRATLDVLKNK